MRKSSSLASAQNNKKTQSDIDSKVNTVDNQSDISRFKNVITADDDDANNEENNEEKVLFPGFVKKTFFIFTQKSKPRFWCLQMITSPYPFIFFLNII